MNLGAVGSALVLLVLVLLSLAGANLEIFSHDVSYYLYVSREVLDGARPYRDFIDPNLPTIIYLGVPVAWLSQNLGIEIWTGFQFFVVVLQIVSLGLCARLLRGWILPGDLVLQLAVIASLLTALWFVPMGLVFVDGSHFGQREHLTLLLIAPYVLWHTVRAAGGEPPRGLVLAVVLMASAGIAIKPHFLVFWLTLEVVTGRSEWQAGRFPRAALLPPLLFGVYFFVLLAVLPEFPTMIENIWRLYGAYRQRGLLEILQLAPVAFPLVVLALHWLLPAAPPLRALRTTLAWAVAAWWTIGLMQLRGFPYHFLPALSFSVALLFVSLLAISAARQWLPVFYAVTVFIGVAAVEHVSRDQLGQDLELVSIIEERVERDGAVLVLSTNVWPGFPAVLYANVRWASRFPSLWFLPGLYEDVEAAAPFPYRSWAEMGPLERWHLDAVVEDFARQPPQLVMVDRVPVQPGFGIKPFDLLAYLDQDPRFHALWCGYRRSGSWQQSLELYERDADRVARCAAG